MKIKFGTTRGLRGFFAVMYDADTQEPINSGIGSYVNSEGALQEAIEWAEAEGEKDEANRLKRMMQPPMFSGELVEIEGRGKVLVTTIPSDEQVPEKNSKIIANGEVKFVSDIECAVGCCGRKPQVGIVLRDAPKPV